MTRQDKQTVRNAIEQIDIDLKFIMGERRKAQAALDTINDKARAAFTRLQNLEAYVEDKA